MMPLGEMNGNLRTIVDPIVLHRLGVKKVVRHVKYVRSSEGRLSSSLVAAFAETVRKQAQQSVPRRRQSSAQNEDV